MSGSVGFPSNGGVDASIPLRAGQGVAPVNPMGQIGDFARTLGAINQTKLQEQALTSGAATVQQHLQQVGSNAMAPFLAIENPTMTDLTNAAAYAEHIAGGTTNHIMRIAQNSPFPPNTPGWVAYMKRSIGALSQTDPATALLQVGGAPVDINNGSTLYSGVRAPGYVGGGVTAQTATRLGLTPGEQNEVVTYTNPSGATRTTLKGPAATSLGGNQPGGAPAPIPRAGAPSAALPSFGNPNGGYQSTPTQPGNPALRKPGASGVATPPYPGARLAPNNKWYVPDPARPGKYLEVR